MIPILRIKIGVSSCLLGEPVRWNGGHKQDQYLLKVLSPFFEWIPVCPEVEVGMGTPRETVRLVGEPSSPKMLGSTSGKDWTAPMQKFSASRLAALSKSGLCGYIFKKDSPSCGVFSVPIYTEDGKPKTRGAGLFASAFREHLPLIPIEEEGRLNDLDIRENFIVRVFSYHRVSEYFAQKFSRSTLPAFHAAQKYLLLSHSPKHYKELGLLVATNKKLSPAKVESEYTRLFMEALSLRSTVRKHVNVLQHMLGFLKDKLPREDKADILLAIEDYRRELLPLIVPLTLIRHYVQKFAVQYLIDQVYLNPHPKELMLRNHV